MLRNWSSIVEACLAFSSTAGLLWLAARWLAWPLEGPTMAAGGLVSTGAALGGRHWRERRERRRIQSMRDSAIW